MLKVDVNLTHVSATPDDVLTLLESINLPLVSIPNVGTAPTQAYVIGLRNANNTYTVMVCLRQQENDANLIYVSEPRELNAEQYRYEEAEGRRFVESMGFLMNDLAVRSVSRETCEKLMQRIEAFERPGRDTLDLIEVADEEAAQPMPVVSDAPDAIFGGLPSRAPQSLPPDEKRRMQLVTGEPELSFLDRSAGGRPMATGRPGFPGSGISSSVPSRVTPPRPPIVQGEAAPEPETDPEALARIGRFLSTFALIALIAAGCVHNQGPAELTPDQQTQLDIAEQQLSQGQWAAAIKTLTPVVDEQPKAQKALHHMGLAYLYLGRSDQAESYLRRAIDADPKYSVAKNSLAALLLDRGDCEEAEQLLLQVVEDIFYPTPELAEDNLARVEHCLGRSTAAIRRLESVVLRRPQFCRGYLTLADISSEQKQSEITIRACEHFTAQCEMNEELKKFVSPEHSCMCYLKKGLAYAQLGDMESARSSWESCESNGAYGMQCRAQLAQLNAQ